MSERILCTNGGNSDDEDKSRVNIDDAWYVHELLLIFHFVWKYISCLHWYQSVLSI